MKYRIGERKCHGTRLPNKWFNDGTRTPKPEETNSNKKRSRMAFGFAERINRMIVIFENYHGMIKKRKESIHTNLTIPCGG